VLCPRPHQDESLATEPTAKSARFITKLRKLSDVDDATGNGASKKSRVDHDKDRSIIAVSHKAHKLKSGKGIAIVEELTSMLSSKGRQARVTLVVSFYGDADHTSQTVDDLTQQTRTSQTVANPTEQTLRFTGGCKQTKKSPRTQGKEHLNASSIEYNAKNSEEQRTSYHGFRSIATGSSTTSFPLYGLASSASPSTPASTSAASRATAPAAPESHA